MLELQAPIISYKSIGNIKLYTHISELYEILSEQNTEYMLESKFIDKYEIKDTIILYFNIFNGKLFKLSALKNYKGNYLNGISVGMDVKKLEKKYSNIVYDEFEEIYHLDGAVLETKLKRNPVTNELEDNITSITIYIKELDELEETLEGWDQIEKGNW